MTVSAILLLVSAYLFGSISSAIILCKLLKLPDPRTEGSNNPGATNVLRIAGKKTAAFVLVFDVLKATLPVVIGHMMGMSIELIASVGMLAVLGHIFPIYYKFEGGKGVATALGFYFGLSGVLGLLCSAVWLIVVKLSRYSSLSSIIMVLTAPLIGGIYFHSEILAIPLTLVAILVIIRHKENIQRLKQGTESETSLFK